MLACWFENSSDSLIAANSIILRVSNYFLSLDKKLKEDRGKQLNVLT